MFTTGGIIMGNYNEEITAGYEVQPWIDMLKNDIEEYTKVKFPYLKAICFRRQSKAGAHYIVKVNVGTDKYIHVKFFRPLPCVSQKVKFVDVQLNKQRFDQITAF